MFSRRAAALPLLLAFSSALAACAGNNPSGDSGESGASSASTVAISATDESCELDRLELEAGQTTFSVTNDGSSVTEVYVYGEEAGEFTRVMSEVENIGPGTSRDMDVDLPSGTYEVACKPGQTGDGIRTEITVTGGAEAAGGEDSESGYDREIELATNGSEITGLEGGAESGERIEFKLTNNADDVRILEVKDPTGAVAAEVEVAVGETGETIVELDQSGTWQIIVEADGVDDLIAELVVS